jgi:propionyl-CoA carboxylase alpha chain
VVTLGEFRFRITVAEQAEGASVAFEGGPTLSVVSDWLPGRVLAHFVIDGELAGIKMDATGTGMRLRWRGMDVVAHVRSPRVAELALLMPVKLPPDTSKMLLCPMPGVITSIAVNVGDQVEAGQALATVEAMKMENLLRAERRATVKRIAAQAGVGLAVDELIMEFE